MATRSEHTERPNGLATKDAQTFVDTLNDLNEDQQQAVMDLLRLILDDGSDFVERISQHVPFLAPLLTEEDEPEWQVRDMSNRWERRDILEVISISRRSEKKEDQVP
ncbi:hypothetical protein VNI00_017686 [Paramarasmius palmivorus]|uniref:Uncharacterized protein n=1 Tax=Paramarasmius palmivorus TaxID=297713 RepID=A0AAW0B4U2_9AGAR